MSNPTGPDHETGSMAEPTEPAEETSTDDVEEVSADASEETTEVRGESEEYSEPATEVLTVSDSPADPASGERRFTAPGFDAGSTQIIDRPAEPATEILSVPGDQTESVLPATGHRTAGPQSIPARSDTRPRSWGWVLALVLVITALAAVTILGTILLTRADGPKVSQQDLVRATIQNFDTAVQKGDLATLRGITCGATRDSYVNYDERAWADTYKRVAAARQYPVVASIDQVVVNGDHAEANVTTFMAADPAIRSTRSFDLQFRDEQWKICQGPDR